MGSGENSVAAATAVVGYDLAKDTIWQQTGARRVLTAVGLCGSAAGGDTKVDIFVDTLKIGEIYNTTTGFPTKDHYKTMNCFVPPNARIHAYVTDAPATNPINIIFDWVDLG